MWFFKNIVSTSWKTFSKFNVYITVDGAYGGVAALSLNLVVDSETTVPAGSIGLLQWETQGADDELQVLIKASTELMIKVERDPSMFNVCPGSNPWSC